jgi:predicted anti-sigma-YlaC factor YlaD
MNCPEWEERLVNGDTEAAEHLLDCPSCAALADGLARDALLLQATPPEASEVDFAAIRANARRGAVQRNRRQRSWPFWP